MAKDTKGDCEFCESVNVSLYPQHGDMMCDACIQREKAVTSATKVIAESRGQDDKIVLKSDVMMASTTAFVELQGAINNNPAIPEGDRKHELVKLAAERIAKLDSAIFEHDALGVTLRNERMAWLKNTQALVATLKSDEQAKYKHLNVNYKPSVPSVDVIKGTRSYFGKGKKAKSEKVIKTNGQKKYSHKDVLEACEKFKADVTTVKMMMIAKNLSPLEAAERYAAKMASN